MYMVRHSRLHTHRPRVAVALLEVCRQILMRQLDAVAWNETSLLQQVHWPRRVVLHADTKEHCSVHTIYFKVLLCSDNRLQPEAACR